MGRTLGVAQHDPGQSAACAGERDRLAVAARADRRHSRTAAVRALRGDYGAAPAQRARLGGAGARAQAPRREPDDVTAAPPSPGRQRCAEIQPGPCTAERARAGSARIAD